MRISDPAKKKEADAATHARQQLAKAGERKDAWQKREEALDALLDTLYDRMAPFCDTGKHKRSCH